MILFTACVLLIILTSLITFFKKKYALEEIDLDALRLTHFEINYLPRSLQRWRRRNHPDPQMRIRSKMALSNLQLFMPI
jgi:hypothetical protein